MELTREYFRAIILHNIQCGLPRQDCIDTLNSFYGKEAMYLTQLCVVGAVTPSYSTIKNWCKRFQHGPVSFQDEFRER